MALSKNDLSSKREKRRVKKAKMDKLTNWYMINLTWGVLGFIALGFIENMFGSADTVLAAPIAMRVIGIVLLVLAAVLFALGKINVIKNNKRAYNYSGFSAACGLIALWIGFYAAIRNSVVAILPELNGLRSEWWYAWGFRYLIAIYLLAALVVIAVKGMMISRSK